MADTDTPDTWADATRQDVPADAQGQPVASATPDTWEEAADADKKTRQEGKK